MRKYLVVVLLLVLVSVLLWGCKVKETRPQGVTQATIDGVEVEKYLDLATEKQPPKTITSKAHEDIQKAVIEYLESAFLDIDLARGSNYKSEVLTFFTKDAQASASDRLAILSLSKDGKNLTLSNNKLKMPVVAVNYDKSNKPTLSSVKVDFDVSYVASDKKVNLELDGWLTLVKEGNDWKIFDYKLEQHLQ